MDANTRLFMLSITKLHNLFKKHDLFFFPTYVSSDFEKLFKRKPLACFAVNEDLSKRCYFYFLSSFKDSLPYFTSILIVPVDAFLTKDTSYATKHHIESEKDLDEFLELLEVQL